MESAEGITGICCRFFAYSKTDISRGGLGNAHRIGGEEDDARGIHVVAIALDPQGRSNAGKYTPLSSPEARGRVPRTVITEMKSSRGAIARPRFVSTRAHQVASFHSNK